MTQIERLCETLALRNELRDPRGPRHHHLRTVTAAVHAEVERLVDAKRFFDESARYGDYLARLHAFHGQFGAVDKVACSGSLPYWQIDARIRWLSEDLTALGIEAAVEPASSAPFREPFIDNAASALGALYVLVGASLGARVLLPLAHALPLPDERQGRVYLTRLASTTDWGGFLRVLESAPVVDDDNALPMLARGAISTFESILDFLTNPHN